MAAITALPAPETVLRRNPYRRRRDLPKLLPLWPAEIDDTSASGRQRLVNLIARALRAERQRGLAGHWSYDLARHSALLKAYRHERATSAIACDAVRKPITSTADPAAVQPR